MQRISITNPQNIIDGTAKKYYFKLRNTGGPKGDKGDKGDTGATGPQGPQGDPCTVVVNSTATLEPGSNAYVTNTGSLSNAVLDFGIPKGDKGDTGPQGQKGERGQQGEQGPIGPQGTPGQNATVYVGTTITTNPGTQARVYNTGTENNAVLNFEIPRGAKGDTGAQGEPGPAGQNFAATVVTELPETGDSSKLYLTPKAHTTSTATGNPVTATVTDGAGALESFQLDGDTFQQSYTGKNLFNDKATPESDTLSSAGITYQIAEDGTITTAGISTAAYKNIRILLTLPAGSYKFNGCPSGGSQNGYSFCVEAGSPYVQYFDYGEGSSFTLTEESQIRAYPVRLGGSTAVDMNGKVFRPMITVSTAEQTYEPYVGGQPIPSPDYPQQIQTVTGEQTVEIVGKNLYAPALATASGTNNQNIRFRTLLNQSTQYTFNTTDSRPYAAVYLFNSDGVLIRSIGNLQSSHTITFTTSSSEVSGVFDFYAKPNVDVSTYDFTGVQLELGSTATAYAPYSKQILPINLGKNLLNTSLGFQYGFIDNSGAYVSNNTIVLFNQYIEVSPATEYRFSSSHTNSNMTAVFYDSNKTFISRILVNTTSVNNFTTPINCRYVRLQANYNATEMSQEIVDSMDLMLSAGSQATTYAPYKTPIELCKLGNYQDYIYKDGDSWKVHKATKKLILDGSEEWLYYNGVCQLNSITDYAISNNTPYCGAFSGNSNVAGLSAVPENSCCFIRVSGETTPRFYVRYESKFSSVDAISQYLTTNPTSLYYALATATDTTITDTTLIAQLEAIRTASLENGANTISNTATGSNLAGDMEIGYYGYNPTNRYDKWLWLDLNNNYEQIGS